MSEHFGTRLAWLISNLQLNQQEFAKRLQCSPAFISEIVRGFKKPGTDFLQRITAEYDVNLDWLICGRGEPFVQVNLEHCNAIASRVQLAIEAARGNRAAINTLKSFLNGEEYIVDSQEAELLKLRVKRRLDEIDYIIKLSQSRHPGESPEEFYHRALSEAAQKYQALTSDKLSAFFNH